MHQLESAGALSVENTENLSVVKNLKAVRKDTADYTIILENRHGSDTATVSVVVLGKKISSHIY